MRAARYHEFGGPEKLQIEQAPQPELNGENVLIQITRAGVSPLDDKVRGGVLPPTMRKPLPLVPGASRWPTQGALGQSVPWSVCLTPAAAASSANRICCASAIRPVDQNNADGQRIGSSEVRRTVVRTITASAADSSTRSVRRRP